MTDTDRDDQLRRHREALEAKRERADEHAAEARTAAEEASIDAADRPPGTVDPRTKSSRHGQVTADKWSQ